MPDIDGYEVIGLLRREPQFAATPILVLTMQSGLQDKSKSFEAGAEKIMEIESHRFPASYATHWLLIGRQA